jgi:hypothetical protein
VSDPGSGPADREARLRPEFAPLYPGVPAGEWHRAALLADMVWARRLERGEAAFQWRERVLSVEHFEFRRGTGPGGESGVGRRRNDRSSSG